MKPRWEGANADVVVIGAGAGGLTAAASLVQAGLRVLVVERSPHIGGTAYTYSRRGFSFPMGPLGFSSPEIVVEALQELGDRPPPAFERARYRLQAFGLDLELSVPFAQLERDLVAAFPCDAQEIPRCLRELRSIAEALRAPPGSRDELLAEAARTRAETRCAVFTDWRLRRLLGSLGTHAPYSSVLLQAAMWDLMAERGIWRPVAGMAALWEGLVGAVRARGEVLLDAEVEEVLVSAEGAARGVRLADGRSLGARWVVSNADFKTTFLSLVPAGAVPGPWRRTIEEASQTESVFQVCLGLDAAKADLSAFDEATSVLYRRGLPGESPVGGAATPEALADQELEISLWGRPGARGLPAGGASLLIRTLVDYAPFARLRLGQRRRATGYLELKESLADALVAEAGRLVPGLREAVVVRDVATPLTFRDQGGRWNGAVAGWSWDYGQEVEVTPRDLVETPVPGLYMAGYQAATGLYFGGVPTAVRSGRRAAEAVLRDLSR